MRFSVYGLCTLMSACLLSVGLYAQDNIVDNSTHETFPKEVSFESNGKQYQLQATGVATRKKLIVKVYSIASYLQKGAGGGDILQAILSDDNAKQLTMKWVRDVGVDKVQEAYKESFHKVFSGQEYAALAGDINQFLQFFNENAHAGDEYILRWLPGGYVEVLINGKKVGSLTNKEFAKGLWNIWFGPKSVVNRNDLVSLEKQ